MEEHRLRVFENRVLRERCGSKKEEVTEKWGKLHVEELCNLYCSQKYYLVDYIKEDETGRTYIMHDGDEKCIQNFRWNTSREKTTWET
jgi:hypothetical protein